MLIVALVLAVVGLAALVTAVVTSNELVAWVCIGASALGVLLLVADAIRERQTRRNDDEAQDDADDDESAADYPDDAEAEVEADEPQAAPAEGLATEPSSGEVADVGPDQVIEVSGEGQPER